MLIVSASEFFVYQSIYSDFKAYFFYELVYILFLIVIFAAIFTLPLLYLADVHWFYLTVFIGYALWLSYLDIRYRWIPDFLSLSLLIFGLMINTHNLFTEFYLAIAGALVGYLFLLIIHILYRITFKQPGIGLGDAKLLAAIGAIVGLKSLPAIVLIACMSCLPIIFLRKKILGIGLRERIFYAPFLMAGMFFILINGGNNVAYC